MPELQTTPATPPRDPEPEAVTVTDRTLDLLWERQRSVTRHGRYVRWAAVDDRACRRIEVIATDRGVTLAGAAKGQPPYFCASYAAVLADAGRVCEQLAAGVDVLEVTFSA